MNVIISIDSEGSDAGAMSILQGIEILLKEDTEVSIRVFVLEKNINTYKKVLENFAHRVTILPASLKAETELSIKAVSYTHLTLPTKRIV